MGKSQKYQKSKFADIFIGVEKISQSLRNFAEVAKISQPLKIGKVVAAFFFWFYFSPLML